MATQYDPYASEANAYGMQDYVADAIKSPFQPSTYLWTHTHIPTMWNMEKGIAVPLSMRGMRNSVGSIVGQFRQSGFKAGMKSIWKEKGSFNPWSGALKMGTKKGAWFGTDLLSEYKIANQYRQSLVSKHGRQAAEKILDKIDVLGRSVDPKDYALARSMKMKTPDLISKQSRKAFKRVMQWREKLMPAAKYNKIAPLFNASDDITRLATGARGLKTTLSAGRGLRTAIGVGKAASIVGLALTAWELTQMVFKPLGAAAISAADNMLTNYSNRFMPETGGQLALSYLSRGAATERQRAVQAMGRAQINGRSAFGQESMYFHQ